MPAPVLITGLTPQIKRSQPAVIAIPGTKRQTSRRSAQNRLAAASAYVVPDSKSKLSNTLTVSVKRNSRLMALTLKGHNDQIIDLEFLASPSTEPIFVLGSCDIEGVVVLWFLHIAKDALGIDVALRLLKKYSFYSLRRSKAAFYTRIRLAGAPDDGTMVLVPNDGSNCRVVNFSCKANQSDDASKLPAIAGTDPVPQLPPPEDSSVQPDKPAETLQTTQEETAPRAVPVVVTGAVAGTVAGATLGATALDSVEGDTNERIIAEGLQGDHAGAPSGQGAGMFEASTAVEKAGEEEEYAYGAEHVVAPVGEDDEVYAEGLIETPTPAYAVSPDEGRDTVELSGEYEQEVEMEEVVEEVIEDEEEELEEQEEELEEQEEEEYEEYEEPEVERVYGEGLSNGHEPNYAPPY